MGLVENQVRDKNAKLRPLHLLSATVVGLFLLMHLANHVAMFWGQEAHQRMMADLRPFYRNPVVEPALMLLLLWQLASGLTMILRSWRERRGLVPMAQAVSGLMLAAFIVNHLLAVWTGRLVMGLDTDLRFAAAGMQAGFAAFFVPYYFLGVFALFVHIGCAIWWRMTGHKKILVPLAVMATGAALATAFVATMVNLPPIADQYLASYR